MPKRELDDSFMPRSKRFKGRRRQDLRTRSVNRRDLVLLRQTPVHPLPAFFETVIKTTKRFTITVPAGETTTNATLTSGIVYLSNAYSPFGDSGATQGYGYDFLASIYGSYRVLSARYTMNITNIATTTSAMVQEPFLINTIWSTNIGTPATGLTFEDCKDNPNMRCIAIPPFGQKTRYRNSPDGGVKVTGRVWIPNWFYKSKEADIDFSGNWTPINTSPTTVNVVHQTDWVHRSTPTPSGTTLYWDYTIYQRVQFKDPSRSLTDA